MSFDFVHRMKICRRQICAFALLVLIPSLLRAQFESIHEIWRWAHFTTASGLPSNQIEEIEETPDGTLWVSTPRGLAWFDGFRWHHVNSTLGLPERQVRIRMSDRSDRILAIVGRHLFIGNEKGFHRLPTIFERNVLGVSDAYFMAGDTIILATEYPLCRLYLLYDSTVTPFPSPFDDGSESGAENRSVWISRYGTLWLNDGSDLFLYKRGEWRAVLKNLGRPMGFRLLALKENKKGDGLASLLRGVGLEGMWGWRRGESPKLIPSEQSHLIKSFDISPHGIPIVSYVSGEIHFAHHHAWSNLDLPFAELRGTLALRFRANGDLLFGTNDGLFLFRSGLRRWTRWTHGFENKKSTINDIFRTSKRELWIATEDGIEIRLPNGEVQYLTKAGGKSLNVITGINEDKEGNIWICSGASFPGAYRWDGRNLKHFGFQSGLRAPRVHKIQKDRSGYLWFLGLGETYRGNDQPGAFVCKDGEFTRWSEAEGLLCGRVYCFQEDSTGALWFGTRDGVSRWSSGRWKHWTLDSLSVATGIRYMTIDADQRLWCSDGASGLRFMDVGEKFRAMTTDNGLLDNIIRGMQCTEDGKLWIATAKGLCVYDHGMWSTFDYRTGLSTPWLNCLFVEGEKVYAGSPGGGLNILDLKETFQPTQIEFEKPVVEKDAALLRWHAYAYWGTLQPGQIETRFRAEDGAWSAWDKSNEVRLAGLPEGRHSLTVQAKDIFGGYSTDGRRIEFDIDPPPYKRPEFALPVAALTTALMALLLSGYWRRRKHRLDLQHDRDRIARDLHDEIGSNLGSVALVSQRLERKTAIPKRYRAELAEITDLAMKTAETLREIVWYINPKFDTMDDLLLQMKDFAGMLLKNMKYTFSVGKEYRSTTIGLDFRRNVYLMFKEILHNIIKHAHASRVSILIDHQDDVFVVEIGDNGIGFDTTHQSGWSGLENVRKRADIVGGSLTITSQPGEGTRINISIRNT